MIFCCSWSWHGQSTVRAHTGEGAASRGVSVGVSANRGMGDTCPWWWGQNGGSGGLRVQKGAMGGLCRELGHEEVSEQRAESPRKEGLWGVFVKRGAMGRSDTDLGGALQTEELLIAEPGGPRGERPRHIPHRARSPPV